MTKAEAKAIEESTARINRAITQMSIGMDKEQWNDSPMKIVSDENQRVRDMACAELGG